MKAAAFEMRVASGVEEAGVWLGEEGARAMAGGQSLGPMLNLRVARPPVVVRVGGLAALQGAEDGADAVTLGAAVTHAAIADGRTADLAGGVLAGVARGIAYRAVRNRGTIGGSLCHADPAADWLTALTALGAVVLTTRRAVGLPGFVTGPYATVLEPGEIVRAVRVPRPGAGFGWGYAKLCRKPGEFAHAMAAVLRDGDMQGRGMQGGDRTRLVIGAVGGAPVVLGGGQATLAGAEAALGFLGMVERRLQLEAVARALDQAGAGG